MEISINDMVIEVTRRCNMECPHCLRGEAQKRDMPKEHIDSLFEQVDYISNLILSGGEPSLVPEILNYIVDSARFHHVYIGNFYIVTNANTVPEGFLIAIIRLYAYCSDNEISGVAISNDQFHDAVPEENIKLLQAFKFTDYKGEIESERVIEEGRGVEFGTGRVMTCDTLVAYKYDDRIDVNEGTLYLNTLGNIIMGCDFSYESQDKPENQLCKVEDLGKKLSEIAEEEE